MRTEENDDQVSRLEGIKVSCMVTWNGWLVTHTTDSVVVSRPYQV